jgi:lipopolysaccharide transport system permease protein
MARPPLALWAFFSSLAKHRGLLYQLTARELAARYKGSWAGTAWSLLMPVLTLALYVFVFGVVFATGDRPTRQALPELGLSIFCGMLVHGLVAESLIRGAGAVLSQPAYVTKVVFPAEVLPLTVVAAAAVQYLVGLLVLVTATWLVRAPGPAVLLVPLLMLPVMMMCAGIALAVAALTVYIRDLAQVTGLAATALLFLSPVFYPVERLPSALRGVMAFNPLTVPIEATRGALLHGVTPDWGVFGLHALASLVIMWAGWCVFQILRRGFSDVL